MILVALSLAEAGSIFTTKKENLIKMEQDLIIKSKSLKYQKKTVIKLSLSASTDENILPKIVFIPSTRDNSIVPGDGNDDLHYLVVHLRDGQQVHTVPANKTNKLGKLSLLSIMADTNQRPSLSSKFRFEYKQ